MSANEHLSKKEWNDEGRESLRKKFADVGLDPIQDPHTGTMYVTIPEDHPLLRPLWKNWEDDKDDE